MATRNQDDKLSIQLPYGEAHPPLAVTEPPLFSRGWLVSVRWALHLRLALAFIASCLACGVLGGFPALEPLLIGAGLFDSFCVNSTHAHVLSSKVSPFCSVLLTSPTSPLAIGIVCFVRGDRLNVLLPPLANFLKRFVA